MNATRPWIVMGLCLVSCTGVPQATSIAPVPSMKIRVVREEQGKPVPLRRVILDMTLRNPTERDLAFLVASKVPADRGGIWVFEEHCLASICHGRYVGSGGFYGFWLAAGATLTVRNLEVIWWNEGPVSIYDLHVRSAERLLLGDEDSRDWFAGDPVVKGNVELDMDIRVANTARRTPDGAEVPVLLLNEFPVDFDSRSR